eukprot:841736-Pleurochrysis_carterae.AAC.1
MPRLRPIVTGGTTCKRHQYGAPLRPWRHDSLRVSAVRASRLLSNCHGRRRLAARGANRGALVYALLGFSGGGQSDEQAALAAAFLAAIVGAPHAARVVALAFGAAEAGATGMQAGRRQRRRLRRRRPRRWRR